MPATQRAERDRRIGQTITKDAPPAEQILAWWAEIAASSTPSSLTPGSRATDLLRLMRGVLGIIGFLVGIGVSGAAFAYRGDYPVNLLALLGVLVGLPLLLLAPSHPVDSLNWYSTGPVDLSPPVAPAGEDGGVAVDAPMPGPAGVVLDDGAPPAASRGAA